MAAAIKVCLDTSIQYLIFYFYPYNMLYGSVNGTCIQIAIAQRKYEVAIRLYLQDKIQYGEQHKPHQQYSLQNISNLDAKLAKLVQSEAALYGYHIHL